jgi:serine phosphatase RsbU (regulator of sigma subunit)
VPGRTYEPHTFALEPGDTVLLYTDGVTDTRGRSDRFGPERLMELLERAPDDPATILQDIEDALRAFEHGSSIDDRAMLVLTTIHAQCPPHHPRPAAAPAGPTRSSSRPAAS